MMGSSSISSTSRMGPSLGGWGRLTSWGDGGRELSSPPLPPAPASSSWRVVLPQLAFSHLYVRLAGIAVGRVRNPLPDPLGNQLVSLAGAPGQQGPSGKHELPEPQGHPSRA